VRHRGGLGIKAHAHMLRHACGYKFANDGHYTRAIQAYLGHRNIQNTTRYTAWRRSSLRNSFEIDARGNRKQATNRLLQRDAYIAILFLTTRPASHRN
jgi:integrase